MAVLNLSTGSVLNANIHTVTARRIVEIGQATVITPGLTGFDVIQLKNATLDTNYQTPPPEQLGIDNIAFLPLTYPEAPLL
jgi:hypothetical protein